MSRFALFGLFIGFALSFFTVAAPVPKEKPQPEWPCLGGSPGRNMANLKTKAIVDDFDFDSDKGILWKTKIGSRSYFTQPVVGGGKILIGTNNEQPRNNRDFKKPVKGEEPEPEDKNILMCFDQQTGKFLWQLVQDKRPTAGVNDWPRIGNPSTPFIDEDRVYVVGAGGHMLCLDLNGMADGNQGIKTEKYQDETDADIIWEVDLVKTYGVFVHNAAPCSPLVIGDIVFLITGNGVDENHLDPPSPEAPSFLALNKFTGKLVWKDNSPGKNIMHGQWSSPAYAAEPVPQIIFPGGDGYLRAFEPATGKLLWKFNGNHSGAKYELGGTGDKCDFVATPVVHEGKLLIGIGQDPEHYTGEGHIWCIDLKKAVEKGKTAKDHDVSVEKFNEDHMPTLDKDCVVTWHFGGLDNRPLSVREFHFGRTISTICVVDNIVYAAELAGYLHCLNFKTGERYWCYDLKSSVWSSPYYADGKVFMTTDSGDIYIFKHNPKPDKHDIEAEANKQANRKDANTRRKALRKELEKAILIRRIEFPEAMHSTPTAVGDVLYLTGESHLYAIGKK